VVATSGMWPESAASLLPVGAFNRIQLFLAVAHRKKPSQKLQSSPSTAAFPQLLLGPAFLLARKPKPSGKNGGKKQQIGCTEAVCLIGRLCKVAPAIIRPRIWTSLTSAHSASRIHKAGAKTSSDNRTSIRFIMMTSPKERIRRSGAGQGSPGNRPSQARHIEASMLVASLSNARDLHARLFSHRHRPQDPAPKCEPIGCDSEATVFLGGRP